MPPAPPSDCVILVPTGVGTLRVVDHPTAGVNGVAVSEWAEIQDGKE